MRPHSHIAVVCHAAHLSAPSLADFLPRLAADGPLVAALIERALERVQNREGAIAAFVIGAASGEPDLHVNGRRVAIEWRGAADATRVVAQAATAIRDGAIHAAAIVAVDAASAEWAVLGLASGLRAGAVQLTHVGDAGTLPVALARADVDQEAIDLIAPVAADAAAAARMIAAWAGEAGLDAAVLPARTASPVLSATTPVRALVSIVAAIEALASRRLPPFEAAADALSRPFSAARAPRAWISGRARRAAVWSETGEHVPVIVFEEPSDRSPALGDRHIEGRRLALLSAASRDQLVDVARRIAVEIEQEPRVPLESRCAQLTQQRRPSHGARASIIAADVADLRAKLLALAEAIPGGSGQWHTPDGVAFSDQHNAGKTAFLFPGQGAQFLGMFGDLCVAMPGLHDWLDRLQATYPSTEYCPPSLIVSPPTDGLTADDRKLLERSLNGISRGAMVTLVGSLALARLVRRAGVQPDAVVGYSNGENTAMVMAGGWQIESLDELLGLLHVVRLHDEDHPVARGACIAVNQAPAAVVEAAMADVGGDLAVALENCPDQRVLFGDPDDIARVSKKLAGAGAIVIPMAFDRGHHTPRYQATVERLRPVYRQLDVRTPELPMYSCVTAAPFPVEPDAIRDLAVSQWARTVRFGATVERLYADGFRTFIEIGPGSTLTGFVRNTLRGKPHTALSTHVPRRPAFDQLLQLLGRLYVQGHDVDPSGLADDHLAFSTRERRPSPIVAAEPAMAALPSGMAGADVDRAPMIDAHFALMREFLDQQARVHEWLMRALGQEPDASPMAPPLPLVSSPLLGDRVTVTPGQLTAIRRFDPAVDVFLRHHTFGPAGQSMDAVPLGLPVMPFAGSLELVAEAAAQLSKGEGRPLQVRDARGSRWLAADRGVLEVRVEAELAETSPDRREVHVKLFDVTGGGPRPSFEAFVAVDDPVAELPALRTPSPIGNGHELAAWFNTRLFHGPLMRRIANVIGLDDRGVSVRVTAPDDDSIIAGRRAILATPMALIDVCAQTMSVWLAQHNNGDGSAYPYLIERFVQFEPVPAGAEATITAAVERSAQAIRADLEIRGVDGRLYAAVLGLSMRIFAFPADVAGVMFATGNTARLSAAVSLSPVTRRLEALPAVVVEKGQGIWLRTIAALTLTAGERDAWYALDVLDREAWLMRRLAAKEVVLDVLAARGMLVPARALATEDAGATILVRVPSAGNESLGVSMISDGSAWVARLDGVEAIAAGRPSSTGEPGLPGGKG